ncbi:MAG: hypothetical protein A2406_00555 [Candidatus Komeilibacteria bacterium RIFOXYC1_FULL_37_11]|uniref:Pseudouridine synthase n=1 Tax=Candidatus Komeilibacteria bacterium RIFOXYC1_FULL_37_11 TaxID=1798555 RepID=A0A1G2BZS4_9BACT|nr:MAG: hypothetical protein A2406_00555 [Candidatus Komeilibacteria bacterium RIFOXYC1_FULL_37_11]OGY95979.1 MAG: hypothetical protein A2611_04165 [Candidatus Komeilibacteria bacterium RIFOXYD1_FULL_37_29]
MKINYQGTDKERLDKYLIQHLGISRSQIKKIILDGQVSVNERLASVHHWLKPGDKIDYAQLKAAKPADFPALPKIVEKTDEFLIIEKPHNLLTHPTDKKETNTLADWLIQEFPQTKKIGDDPTRPAIVHRLDKEVSGLMVIPLTQASFDNLKNQFQDRTITKEYTALVHGQMINESGEVNTPLERDKKTGLMKVQSDKYLDKPAITIYQVVKKLINYTLLKVQIKTGRMHQIRAHFYSIGHSVVGDKLYQTKDIRKKKKVLEQRIFLHASYLKFKDLAGNNREYNSKLPGLLQDFLNKAK